MGNAYLNRGAHYKIGSRGGALSERRTLNPIITVVSSIFSPKNKNVKQNRLQIGYLFLRAVKLLLANAR